MYIGIIFHMCTEELFSISIDELFSISIEELFCTSVENNYFFIKHVFFSLVLRAIFAI